MADCATWLLQKAIRKYMDLYVSIPLPEMLDLVSWIWSNHFHRSGSRQTVFGRGKGKNKGMEGSLALVHSRCHLFHFDATFHFPQTYTTKYICHTTVGSVCPRRPKDDPRAYWKVNINFNTCIRLFRQLPPQDTVQVFLA